MVELVAVPVAGALAAVAGEVVRRRRAARRLSGRVRPRDLGLDRIPPGGVFVQYSVPANVACRVALNRLAEAAAHADALVVELPLPPGASPRAAPIVLYVDQAGLVRRRWTAAPERSELAATVRRRTPAYDDAVAASR